MRNLKRVLALAMAMLMILGMMVIGTSAASYTDAATIEDQYVEAVDVLTGMGVFQGTDSGTFAPKAVLTRAEAAALIYRVITGDVNDAQVKNYNYGSLKDVKAGDWYTGYVTYANNGGFIKGDENGNFNPKAQVTGIQVMAIMLRAAGYGKNGEYEGDGWKDNILTDGFEAGMIGNIATATLDAPATRELVAQLIFNALVNVNMVTYTPALGYVNATWMNNGNTTLGKKVFGLTDIKGYITANQATGEAKTVLGQYPAVKTTITNSGNASSWTLNLNMTTGLDQFGHYTKVWYSNKDNTTVYASYDLGSSATVTAAEYGKLTTKASYFSNSYGTISETDNVVWDYNILVTNPGTADDVLVRLNLDIAQYTAINHFTTEPYLTVKSGATKNQQVIKLANATGYEDVALGSYVNVLTVNGTNAANKAFPQKQISALTGYTGVKVTYITADGTVTLNDGSIVKSSSNTHKGYAANVNTNMDIRNGWNFSKTYNIYTDMFGNYVGAIEQTNYTYAKLTYAYYDTDIFAGTIAYYAQVVYNDGTTDTIKLDVDATGYNALTCTKLTWGGSSNGVYNSITKGDNMDVVLVPSAKGGYTIEHVKGDDDCSFIADAVSYAGLTTIGRLTNSADAWVVKKNTTTLTLNNNYFVDTNTKFVVVSGFGAGLTINTYTLAELIGDNLKVAIPADAIVTASKLYTANIASNNYHVDYVLIENPVATPVSNLIYVVKATGAWTNDGKVYDAYVNGVAKQIVIKNENALQLNNKKNFYQYTVSNDVYTITGVATSGCGEDVQLTTNNGTWYLFVNDVNGIQRAITNDATIINLTNVQNVPTSASELAQAAAENNRITIDFEIVDNAVTVVYIVNYVAAAQA